MIISKGVVRYSPGYDKEHRQHPYEHEVYEDIQCKTSLRIRYIESRGSKNAKTMKKENRYCTKHSECIEVIASLNHMTDEYQRDINNDYVLCQRRISSEEILCFSQFL